MRARLVLALAAVVAVAGVALWGLFPARAGAPTAGGKPPGGAGTPARTTGPPTPPTPSASAGWRLIFDGQFSGSALNTAVWATCYPWMDVPAGCTNFGNHEFQWFLPSQDQVSGGVLHLLAQRLPTAGLNSYGGPKVWDCRSGMVTTYPSFRFKYGYLQVVARIPAETGMWSALWLAAANRQWPPEIDVLEQWGRRTGLYFHPIGGAVPRAHPNTANLNVGWHTFSVNWTPSRLDWFIDGRSVMSVQQNIPHQLMYFIADLADSLKPRINGGCSTSLDIRSVKVWQQ